MKRVPLSASENHDKGAVTPDSRDEDEGGEMEAVVDSNPSPAENRPGPQSDESVMLHAVVTDGMESVALSRGFNLR